MSATTTDTSQLDASLTSMEWLSRLGVNKQPRDNFNTIKCVDQPTPPTPQLLLTPSLITPTTSKIIHVTAQRAEPHRPIDLNAQYKPPNDLTNRPEGKPPYSYVNLITFAINSTAPKRRMTLNEIYEWIVENFPYYKNIGNGWKNSVRHNLSLNKCFVRITRSKNDPGKGAYWSIDTSYQEVAMSNPIKMRQKTESNDHASNSSDSPRNTASPYSPSVSPNPQRSVRKSNQNQSTSFVDSHFAFDDLNSSFKRLYKTFVDQELVYKPKYEEFCSKEENTNDDHHTDIRPAYDPILSSLNNDFSSSFDAFLESVKIAGNLDWSEIDTTDFQELVQSINENLDDSEKFINLASSLKHLFDKSNLISKHKKEEEQQQHQQEQEHENNQYLNVPQDMSFKKASGDHNQKTSNEHDHLKSDNNSTNLFDYQQIKMPQQERSSYNSYYNNHAFQTQINHFATNDFIHHNQTFLYDYHKNHDLYSPTSESSLTSDNTQMVNFDCPSIVYHDTNEANEEFTDYDSLL